MHIFKYFMLGIGDCILYIMFRRMFSSINALYYLYSILYIHIYIYIYIYILYIYNIYIIYIYVYIYGIISVYYMLTKLTNSSVEIFHWLKVSAIT